MNLTYDVQGNLSSRGGVGYTFDYGNRLRSTAGIAYRYDAQGRRVRQDNAGGQLKYSFYTRDGRIVWQRDEQAGQRIHNLYLAGSLVAEYRRPIGSTAVTVEYQHTDALGSPIARTNAAGTVIQTSEYEPYGKLLNRANDDRAGYTGHVMDAASGMIYMQQRYYDPELGVFDSVDPVTAYSDPVGQFHRYRYANNSPYKFTDPDGRFVKNLVNAAIGGLVAGELEAISQIRQGNIAMGKLDSGSMKAMRSVMVETARGAAIGLITGKVASSATSALSTSGVGSVASKVASTGAASMAAGYSTLATGPVSDIARGDSVQSMETYGDEAVASMAGTIVGSAAGGLASTSAQRIAPASGSVVGRAVARTVEEATSTATTEVMKRDP